MSGWYLLSDVNLRCHQFLKKVVSEVLSLMLLRWSKTFSSEQQQSAVQFLIKKNISLPTFSCLRNIINMVYFVIY